MTNFLKFHIELILQNKTTIEFLEKKGEPFESQYNIDPMHNWRQVFGYNVILWFFPVSWASGHPIGDGIYWQINPDVKVPEKRSSKAQQSQQDQQSQNSENKRLIVENNSHKFEPDNSANNESKRSDDNKENMNQKSQVNENSSRANLQYNSDAFKHFDKNLDTVVNRKDDNNTLIVHSQDKNKMLKNTLLANR